MNRYQNKFALATKEVHHIDRDRKLYCIRTTAGKEMYYETLGFDECSRRINFLGEELGIEIIPYVKGSKWAYKQLQDLYTEVRHRHQKDGFQSKVNLEPLLVDLEGWRVEVTYNDDSSERFIVGKSTGWCPCNIMLKKTNSHGGMQTFSNIKHVQVIERVR